MSVTIDLTDRVVLVTGGSKGIGRAIAEAYVAAGARVVTCARSEAEALPGTRHVTCDVRDPDAVVAMVEDVAATEGRLDVAVNNAGGAPYALAADASPRFHAKVLDLNFSGPLVVAQAANRVMQGQDGGGAIVNISSVSALRPSPGTAVYGAAKAALDSLTTSLAMEWAPRVRLNSINVGLCRTELTGDHYGGDAQVAAIEATIPLGRMARPDEVAAVALFLGSDLASYVSGASVACHGGGEPPDASLGLRRSSLHVGARAACGAGRFRRATALATLLLEAPRPAGVSAEEGERDARRLLRDIERQKGETQRSNRRLAKSVASWVQTAMAGGGGGVEQLESGVAEEGRVEEEEDSAASGGSACPGLFTKALAVVAAAMLVGARLS